MTTVAKTFSAAGESAVLTVVAGQSVTYAAAGRVGTALATTQTVTATGDVLNASPIWQASGEVLSGDDRFFLGCTIDNVMDEFVLAYQAGTNNQTILGALSYTIY